MEQLVAHRVAPGGDRTDQLGEQDLTAASLTAPGKLLLLLFLLLLPFTAGTGGRARARGEYRTNGSTPRMVMEVALVNYLAHSSYVCNVALVNGDATY